MTSEKPILIIEDDEASAFYLEEILAEMGQETILATTGLEAASITEARELSMILIDIRLPDIDGYLLTKQFREKGMKIPIIAQTAYVMSDDRQKAINSGCDDYLPKPILRRNLVETLSKYIELKNFSL